MQELLLWASLMLKVLLMYVFLFGPTLNVCLRLRFSQLHTINVNLSGTIYTLQGIRTVVKR